MLLTDFKSVIKFLDIEILEEIAKEFVTDTLEKQKQYPILEQIKEYWFDEAEEELSISFEDIDIDEAELEAKEYEENPDNWVYDKETGGWDEKYPEYF